MRKVFAWSLGVVTLAFLTVVSFWNYLPPLAGSQQFELTLPGAPAGTREPLIVTGRTQAGDFLFVKYLADGTVAFGYDSWSRGGPLSNPVPFKPNVRQTLSVDMPALAQVPGSLAPIPARLRVIFNGIVVLDAEVHSHSRRRSHLWFARNPLGGTACDAEFHGELRRAGDSRLWHGRITELMTRPERLRGWLWFSRWQLLAILFASGGLGWAVWRASGDRLAVILGGLKRARAGLKEHRAFALMAMLCTLAFAAIITNGTFRLIYPEVFGDFYDYQAVSLLQGRLDVPYFSLQGESFIYEGKTYGYFGPTPALVRLPLVIFGVGFGEVSRAMMLGYYLATLLGAYAVLLHLMGKWRPERPKPATWETLLFTAHVGLGSTVFFLGSRAYIYHEAILCGIMFAVWSCWCSLRYFSAPASRWWLGALLLGVLSIHARPPAGLFALVLVAGCALAPALGAIRTRNFSVLRRPLAIAAVAGAGVVSFNALSYLKFHTIDGCPLRLNVQYTAKRLEKIDGKQFHFSNLRYGLDTYFFNAQATVSPQFPWLYLPPKAAPNEYPRAKIDLADYTLAFPAGMTGLFALATIGCAWMAWRRPESRLTVAVLWGAFLPLTIAMCAAIATAERYTGDFVPFFICAGAMGLTAPGWHKFARGLLILATVWSCALTLAVTLHYQGMMVWGVPDEVTQQYVELRHRVDRFFGVTSDAPVKR
jgi:hypothetical protein